MLRLLHAWCRRLSAGVALAAFALSIAMLAQASDAGRSTPRLILLLRTPGDDDTMVRLRLELTDGGWRILELRPDPLEAESLAATAERERVAAAVRVDAPHGSVELWVRRDEGAVTEEFSALGEPSSGHVLAVRVAEALRARGLLLPPGQSRPEPAAAPEPAPPVVPPPATTAAPSAERDHEPDAAPVDTSREATTRFALELGPGIALSPGHLGPLAVLDTGVRVGWGRTWSLSALGLFPISHQALSGAEGEARIATTVVAGFVEAEWLDWSFGGVRSGLGAGASITSMSGHGATGFRDGDDTVTAFAALFRSSFHANLGAHLRLRTALVIGATFPAVRIEFGEREAATWGRPFGVASLALEASVP
jgi:hypothetical protein